MTNLHISIDRPGILDLCVSIGVGVRM